MNDQLWKKLPIDLVHHIIQYTGKVIYRNGRYIDINRVPINDNRYNLIRPLILKKIDILYNSEKRGQIGFYFQWDFDGLPDVGLCYDFNFSFGEIFEICYYDNRVDLVQLRTEI